MQTLKSNSLLQGGRYKILGSLCQGGFGITYLAVQSGLDRKVAIKEFFMKELCNRDDSTSHVTFGTEGSRETVTRFREKFLKEARNIAKLKHPNIVSIIDVFEENGTAYYVMEYVENGSLADKVKRQGYLSEPEATRYIRLIADALDYIHQRKMNHLDVKPANIMLNEKDEPVLIDFGLSKQYDATTGNQTSTTPVGISEGYAPMEQYKQGGVGAFSPQTDIYALGATFFKLLTGVTPPSASDVNEDGVPVDELKAKGVSQKAIDVICMAMKGRKKDRMEDVRTFIDLLKGKSMSDGDNPRPATDDNEETVIIGQEPTPTPPEPKPSPKLHFPKKLGITALIIVIVGSLIGIVYHSNPWATLEEGIAYYDKKEYDKAFPILLKYAKKGDATAQCKLGNCYKYGDGVQRDERKAVEWWTKAAEQGDAGAQSTLGNCYFYGDGVRQDYSKAVEWYTKAAEQGLTWAQYHLGDCYRLGEGVQQDYSKAVEWYTKAAEQGDAEAQCYLGFVYELGCGGQKDYKKAVEWYTKAAEQGDADAQYHLGDCYYFGNGVQLDHSKAVEWWTKAAEQGHTDAKAALKRLKTVERYTKAAEQGDAKAQYHLGDCYYFGNGVQQDYSKAVEWYTKAAEQGDAEAQCNLGNCYYDGYGVQKDYKKAAEWYTKAAEQGHTVAKVKLEILKFY